MKCSKCKKEKDEISFKKGEKIVKHCFDCRETARLWREKNKERVSDYNKLTNTKNKAGKKVKVVYGKKKEGNDDWIKYTSLTDAAKKLGLNVPNISKVINGGLSQTGGYIFKFEMEESSIKEVKSWDNIKEDMNYNEKKPSSKRTLHEFIDGIEGKKCCSCKVWVALTNFNNSKKHWDELRNDCKDCLVKYRRKNVKKISSNYLKYEKNRKKIDPEFKLLKTLRSRLSNAIKKKNGIKVDTTMNLTGCTITFLKGYLEAKFIDGMSWENHGEWHIDHIKPCCSFNLLDEGEQKLCFHYKNLQPLWGVDNLSKGGTIKN